MKPINFEHKQILKAMENTKAKTPCTSVAYEAQKALMERILVSIRFDGANYTFADCKEIAQHFGLDKE